MSKIYLANLDNQLEILELLKSGGGDSHIFQLAEFDSTASKSQLDSLKSKRNIKDVAASSTAMSAVANSSTAMSAVANSSTAMSAVLNSSTAMSAVLNSSTAMSAVTNSKYVSRLNNEGPNNGRFIILGSQSVSVLDDSRPGGAKELLNSSGNTNKLTSKYNSKYGELYNCLKITGNQVYTMLDPWYAKEGYWVYCLDLNKLK